MQDINKYLRLAKKAKTTTTAKKNINEVLKIDPNNKEAILLLSLYDNSYIDKSLEIADTLIQEGNFDAFIIKLYHLINLKKFKEAISFLEYSSTKLESSDFDFDTIIYFLKSTMNESYPIKAFSDFNIISKLYEDYKNNNIKEQDILDISIETRFILDSIIEMKDSSLKAFLNIYLDYNKYKNYFLRINAILSLIKSIIPDYDEFVEAVINTMNNINYSSLVNPTERVVLICIGFATILKTNLTIKKLLNFIKEFKKYYPFSDETQRQIMALNNVEIKECVESLIDNDYLEDDDYLELSPIGNEIFKALFDEEQDKTTIEFKNASDFFNEALQETDNQAFFLEKAKCTFSKFFDADIIPCYSEDFPLEKAFAIYKRIYDFIHFNKIDVEEFYQQDDTIFSYYVSAYNRICDRIITYSILTDNKELAINTIKCTIKDFKDSSKSIFIVSMLYALKIEDPNLLHCLRHNYNYNLENDTLLLFDLINAIKHNSEDLKEIVSQLTFINPYFLGFLSDYMSLDDSIQKLDMQYFGDFENQNLNKIDNAIVLVSLYKLVYSNDILKPCYTLYKDNINKLLDSMTISLVISTLNDLYSLKGEYSLDEIKHYLLGEKIDANLKALKSFGVFKNQKKKYINDLIETFINIDILEYNKDNKIILTLFGLTLIKNSIEDNDYVS